MKSIFDQFTQKYSLSKTLRFELRPVGKTRDWMNEHLKYDKDLQTFFADQKIEDAYQVLKPVFDKLHEDFITKSLENSKARQIDFSGYFTLKRDLIGINKKVQEAAFKNKEKEIENEEKKLRESFGEIYKAEGDVFKITAGLLPNGKPVLKEDGYKVLTEAGILKYIHKNIDTFVGLSLKTHSGKIVTKIDLEKALGTAQTEGVFEGFFTYFSGFNQNRENYYVTKEEQTTAVASRVVGENLPKFCDNILDFEKRKTVYEGALEFLKNKNIAVVDKGQNPLHAITSTIFEVSHFNVCMSQTGIEAYNKEMGNANFVINLYNQQQIDKSQKLRFFKILYKQIGCGEKGDFLQSIKSPEELKERLRDVAVKGDKFFVAVEKITKEILSLESFNDIYWSDKAINIISSKYFGDWMTLKESLKNVKVFKSDKGEIKVPQIIELSDLFVVLDSANSIVAFKESFKDNDTEKQKIKNESNSSNSQKLLKMMFVDILANRKVFESKKSVVLNMVNHKYDENTQIVKDWLDSLLFTNQILKYFKVRENKVKGSSLNAEVYNPLEEILSKDNPTKEYDIVRNYLTQKPTESLNKLKLNFKNASLADGWDENKIADNHCVIVRDKDDNKYLAILTEKSKKFFAKDVIEGKGKNKKTKKNELYEIKDGEDFYWKMEYKQIATPTGIGGFVRKCFNSAQLLGWICPENCLNSEGKIVIKNDEAEDNLKEIIDCYKSFFNVYEKDGFKYKDYNFVLKDSNKYETLNDFFNDIERQGYKLNFTSKINKEFLDSAVATGMIYLFEIRNKDSNLKDKQKKLSETKNLHTIYWNSVFSESENKPKLNGKAEIFYQPIVQDLLKDKDKDGNIIKASKKRFEREKFVFHCNLTLNFQRPDKWYKNSEEINRVMVETKERVCFIGIDRGEKHLAFYSVINQKGEILEQSSFNVIKDEKSGKEHNYAEKLAERSGDRDEARKNWKTIGTIKELKDGYISQVVRKIVDLAMKHNAYIVLEKLDKGFKRGRQKIEKQVYQKLELALAKKLNFLVNKKVEIGTVGSVTNALQLTPPVANFQDIEGKSQFGIMLYVRANYTSQTDPITGWRKSIYLKKGSEDNIKKQIADSFTDILFDGQDYCFTYKDQNRNIWELYSGKNGVDLDRYYRERMNEHVEGEMKVCWTPKKQEIKKTLDGLFESCDKNRSILTQIIDEGVEPKKIDANRTAWESLRFVINVIQQIRNTGTEKKDDDFLLSPVRDRESNHFDSRKQGALIPNGDANGAYNIARKGLMLFQKENGIRQKPEKPDLFIEDKEWDAWLKKN